MGPIPGPDAEEEEEEVIRGGWAWRQPVSLLEGGGFQPINAFFRPRIGETRSEHEVNEDLSQDQVGMADRSRNRKRVENQPGHRPFSKYNLPSWVKHPLRNVTMQSCLIFPGEYNQYAGMLAKHRDMPEVYNMLELATEAFGYDVRLMMEEGDIEEMGQVDYSMMLMYVADCAAYEVLKKEHPEAAANPKGIAGFGVGEYAALYAAGVITYDQGLIIVSTRAKAIKRWSEKQEMSAVGIYGLPESRVRELCLEAQETDGKCGNEDPQADISHCWAPTGFVCAGRTSTIRELFEVASRLEEPFVHEIETTHDACHTPLVPRSVQEEVNAVIEDIPMEKTRCDLYFNAGFRVDKDSDPDDIYDLLKSQLVRPLRWDTFLFDAIERGTQHFYECGPGHSLQDLMVYNVYSDAHGEMRPIEFTTSLQV